MIDQKLTRKATLEAPRVEAGKAPLATIRASTGADVERFDWMTGETYVERLLVSDAAVDMGYLSSGRAHLLSDHNSHSTGAVLGTVTRAWIKSGELYAEVRGPVPGTSPRLDETWGLIKQGILVNVSVGYHVNEFTETRENDKTIRTATRWEVLEISLVALGADSSAVVLSARAADNPPKKEPVMNENHIGALSGDDAERVKYLAKLTSLTREQEADILTRAQSLEEARKLIINAAADNSDRVQISTASSVGCGGLDEPGSFVRAAGEAIFARYNPRHMPSEQARPFMSMSMSELARASLERSGHKMPLSRTPNALVERALHVSSDFSELLVNGANRSLREGYAQVNSSIRTMAAQRNHRDFRGMSRVLLDHSGFELKKVNEHGNYTYGTMEQAKSSYRLETFGRVFGITRQALVNDDLGAFDDMNRKLGRAAADFEVQQLVNLLTDNSGLGPVMDDGVELFSSSHSNLAASGAAISVATLTAARLAMRQQRGPGGGILGVKPTYLLVSPENETTAEQLLTSISATQSSSVNPFSNQLQLIVEPRLSGKRWYVAASPAEIDGLSFAFLEGEPGPQITMREGFEVDGVEFKVRLDYGCGFEDWRSWYSNAGE